MLTQYAPYPSLHSRTVLITGGASGIGASLVEAFTLQGSQVIFLDIQDDPAHTLITRLSDGANPTPIYHHCDLTHIPALQLLLAKIQSHHLTPHTLPRHPNAHCSPPEYAPDPLSPPTLNRHLQPEEAPRLALFLAADDSSAIPNQTHIIDGGWI